MKKALLWSVCIFVGFIVVILFIPTLFKNQVSSLLKHELNSSLHADVAFSDAEINLWRNFPQFTITLEDFAIAGKNEFAADTLIRANELILVINSAHLIFNDGLEVKHLHADEPEINISILRDGKANYDITLKHDSDTTDEVSFDLESCEISNGRLRYSDRSSDFTIQGQAINLTGGLSIKGAVTHFSLDGNSKAFGVTIGETRYMQEKNIMIDLEGAYDSKNGTLKVAENTLKVNDLRLTFSANFGFTDENVAIDVKVRTDEAAFEDFLSLNQTLSRDLHKMDIQGRMSLDAEVLGVYNSKTSLFPAFKANLIVNEGSIKYHSLPSSVNQISFDLAAYNTDGVLENTIVDLQYFGMNVGENPLFGSARIEGFKDGKIAADMMASIPLAEIATVYPLEGMELKGVLDFQLKANGPYTGKLLELTRTADRKASRVPSFHVGVELTDGHIKYANLADTIKDINLHLSVDNTSGILDDTNIRIEKLHALFGDNPVSGDLTFIGLSEPFVKGTVNATLDLSEIANFYPIDALTLRGMLEMDIKLDGQWSEKMKRFPKVNASVEVSDAYIKSAQYPAPMEHTHLVLEAVNETGKFADTRLVVDTLTYSIENESFFVTGYVNDLEKYNYDVKVTGVLYLDKLQKILALENVMMSGEVDLAFKAAGNLVDLKTKRYHRLPTDGQMRMRDVYFRNKTVPHGLRIKEGHLFFSNEKIFLDTLHGQLGESAFNLTGHLYNYLAYFLHPDEAMKGDLLFESDNFDINELLGEKKTYRDTIHHDLPVLQLPANVDFTFDSRVARLFYKNLALTNLNGEIVLRNGVLTLNNTSFDAMDAAFSLSGDYDARNIAHPTFELQLGIHELDINKAHDAFVTVQAIAPAAEHTYGIFSIDYKLKGELTENMLPVFSSLVGEGTVRIRDAKVNGMKLFHHMSGLTKKEELMNPNVKDIVMEVNVGDGIIHVKPFTLKLGGFDTEITGRHELTGSMNYIVKIALPPFDIVKIPLHVDGTYDNPRVHIGKGHEEALKKTIGYLLTSSPLAQAQAK